MSESYQPYPLDEPWKHLERYTRFELSTDIASKSQVKAENHDGSSTRRTFSMNVTALSGYELEW